MMKNMKKVLNMREGRHGLAYGYLLNHGFEYYGVKLGRGVRKTIQQALSHTTLAECEHIQLKARAKKSPMSDLSDQKEALKRQVEELTAALARKDAEVILLKAKLAQDNSEGPGSAELIRLKQENAKQAMEIKSLTQKFLQAHQDSNMCITFLIQSIAPKSSGS